MMPVAPAVSRPLPRAPLYVLGGWAVLSFAFAHSGLLTLERITFVPVVIGVGVAVVVLGGTLTQSGRQFVEALDLRWFLALHALRLPVGLSFLYALEHGGLDRQFALTAGFGDVGIGIFAVALLLVPAWRGPRALWAFNVLGLADILAVLVSAQRILFFGDPSTMHLFLHAPYPMIPSLLVPLVVGSHLLLFGRLRRDRQGLTTSG